MSSILPSAEVPHCPRKHETADCRALARLDAIIADSEFNSEEPDATVSFSVEQG